MTIPATKEGTVAFRAPSIESPCSTYYRIYGDLSAGVTPVVIMHGGPGAGLEYLLSFAQLWSQYGVPVVFYDQIGCGSSTHLRQKAGDFEFWTEDLFLAELDNLVDFLHLRGGFHLLGQSFGGMLAAAYATKRPQGLERLVLASALASSDLSDIGRQLQLQQLPPDAYEAIKRFQETGHRGDPAYEAAVAVYYRKFMCRADPFPPEELQPAFKNFADDLTVSHSVWGETMWKVSGSLVGWTCIPRLPNIDVPTLVFNGEYDTSHDVATAPFFENIPRVRWITFANGGHMCHIEEGLRERVLRTVGEFLTQQHADMI